MRVFGEQGYEHVLKQFTKKFDARTKKVILVGYDGESTNYRLYHPDTKKVTVSRNVIFQENVSEAASSDDDSNGEEQMFARREEPAEQQQD